ncbi:MAG: hypothetical protein ACYC21_03180 [Eubacteriales bacterium]
MKIGTKVHIGSLKTAIIFTVMVLLLALLVVGCSSNTTTTTGDKTSSTATTPAAPGGEATSASAQTDENAIAKNECSECHEMWPEVTTWQTSVHAKVPCTTCHTGVTAADFKAAHDGGFQKPIATRNKPVSDEVCRGCHAMQNRLATLLPDLIAPHERHEAGKVQCLACHRFTTHGNIAERKVTNRPEYANYDQWNPVMAEKAAPQVMRRPNMFVCINCHEGRKVTTKCAACHYYDDRKSLPSHEDAQWKVVHGKAGRADVNNCAKCHYDKESQKFATPSTGDVIADFARANSYCYGCHLKRPATHDGQWMSKHATFAKQRGTPNCFACHDKNQPGANVTGTYCNTCHWFANTPPPAPAAKK